MGLDKYERKELARGFITADDISLYPQKLAGGRITYGGSGRGERKGCPIKLRIVKTEGRPPQFIMELLGEYHVEELSYYTTEPSEWMSYGKLWLSLEQARKLSEFLSAFLPQ